MSEPQPASASSLHHIDNLLTEMKQTEKTAQPVPRPKKENKPDSVRAYDYRNQLIVASQYVLSRLGTAPIAIVLGSGLGGFGDKLQDVKELPYSDIPFLPTPTVKGHSGKIMMGYLISADGETRKRIMCFSGRLHPYEGVPMFQVTFCARLAYLCGVHTLILTNAAGGCIPKQQAGSVVIMTDYVRDVMYAVLNHSANDQMFGVRHMKCDKLLDKEITDVFIKTAQECKFPYHTGTYWWTNGPCYETASQVRFAMSMRAHAVGMSTVPSILAAKNIGLRVAAMSLCTNVAAGLEDEPLNHAIVVENAQAAAVPFGNFVEKALLAIDNPPDFNQYDFPYSPRNSDFNEMKLNLGKLDMRIDTASFDEYIFPRKHLGTYSDLYKDIAYVRRFLSNILDLRMTMAPTQPPRAVTPKGDDSGQKPIPTAPLSLTKIPSRSMPEAHKLLSGTSVPPTPAPSHKKQFQPPIDFAPAVSGKPGPPIGHQFHQVTPSEFDFDEPAEKVQNRDGPIPIWILHDPFRFDTTTLQCPISVPIKTLWGFTKISTTASARNAILNFGFDQHHNLIVVLSRLSLEGFSFDECNYIINLLYGVLGHKNLYFTNMFYAFPSKTMYTGSDDDEKTEEDIPRGQYALIKDSVDFKGGFARFPRPLFPPTEINTSDCYVRMKYGVFGNTKTTDAQVECLKGFKGFFDGLNKDKKTNVYSYAYWSGPNWPSPAELNISNMAKCEISGISNPFMTPMSRQLGHDGYSVAYIGTNEEFDGICSSKGTAIEESLAKDVTPIIFQISSSIITFFKSSACLFSPASMNRNRPSVFNASRITDMRLYESLADVNVPHEAPQYQRLHTVDDEWAYIKEAAEWLGNVWNFNDHPISNALFSSFSHVIDPLYYNADQDISDVHRTSKISKRGFVSLDLVNLPGWKEHFCGGMPYSHYHWDDDNPFEWTLKIFRYDIDTKPTESKFVEQSPNYYIVIAPHFFTNTKLHPQRYAYMTSFYKYTPRFWNLSFILRVLWKLGVKNVCFLSHMINNNCQENKEFSTLAKNSVVSMNNYVDSSRWNVLMGPNDDRMGPRFIPITDPMELEERFLNIAKGDKFQKKIPSVITVHSPSSATISDTTSKFYGNLGYQTRVLGLIPCIQTAQHLGLKKLCVGITDYSIDEKIQNVESFNEIVKMIEVLFGQLELDRSGQSTQTM